MARFFVCLATVVFVRCCRRLDLVIDVLSMQTVTTDTSSKRDAEFDD